MEKGIYEKLNNVENLDERILLKGILNSVFSGLEKYSKERLDDLEKRVFDEIPYDEAKYTIFCTIMKKTQLDPTDDFMYPILEEDAMEQEFEIDNILQALSENTETKMFKVFLKSEYSTFNDFTTSGYKFKGRIETNKKVHTAYFKVEKNREYDEQIRMLYSSFIDNNITWTTINNPYIHKIADVILTGCEDEIEAEEEILKIDVDFGEFNSYIEYGMVPLWNIKKLQLKCSGFPTPCIDKVNYEHEISTVKEGINNGYLVSSKESEINYVIFRNDSVVACTNTDEIIKWDVLKIVHYPESNVPKYEFELMTNKVKVNFSNRMALEKRYTIKTRSELSRVINSFEASNYLRFKNAVLKDYSSDDITDEIYDSNDFIIDEIRDDHVKKKLILQFEPVDKEYYLNNDILSFLVSEVSFIYPEYKCEGRLL